MRKLRKRAQKQINHFTRGLNKNLLNDELWRGRFYVHQVDANWEEFDDKSGGELHVWLEVRDKKTGLFRGFAVSNYGTGWNLWSAVNEFIVKDSHVWDNIDEVKNDKTDWTKVKWKPVKEIY